MKLIPLLAIVTLGFNGLLFAQEDDPKHPYAVFFGIDVDDEGSIGAQGAFSIAVLSDTWLNVTAGTDRSPDDLADLDLFAGSLGLDHRFKSGFGLSAIYDYWGDQDALTRSGFELELNYGQDAWRIGAGYIDREYDVTVEFPLAMDVREVGFGSDGFTAYFRYFGDKWGTSIRTTSYDFDIDPRVLNTRFAIDRLGVSAITLSDSLLDSRTRVSLQRRLEGNRMIEVSVSRNESAVDDTDSDTLELAIITPLGDRTDLEISFGTVNTEQDDNILFGGFLLTFYGP